MSLGVKAVFACGLGFVACAQKPVVHEAKVIIVSPGASYPDDVIAVPLERSVRFTVNMSSGRTKPTPVDETAKALLLRDISTNGLEAPELKPWHAVISFEQFDEDGDKVDEGTFEEFWISLKRYRETYKSNKLNQTDFSTEQGVFRQGDQRWPDRTEVAAKQDLLLPLAEMQGVHGFRLRASRDQFGAYTLRCEAVETDEGQMNVPRKLCFDSSSGALRYIRGAGWLQIAYNENGRFQGRYIANDVFVGDGPKAHISLHLVTLTEIQTIDDTFSRHQRTH